MDLEIKKTPREFPAEHTEMPVPRTRDLVPKAVQGNLPVPVPRGMPVRKRWLPIALAVACISITVIGLLAGFLPANRAAHLNPTEALRYE